MPDGDNISINLGTVGVIGIYTTNSGPYADDWFLAFVHSNGTWQEISVYADGYDELTSYLSGLYDTDLTTPSLTSSTVWASAIRYPKHLAGKELFVLQPPKGYKPPTNLLQILKSGLGIGAYGKDWEMDLTDWVKSELEKPGT